MGAYSPLPDVDDGLVGEIVARFHRPALAELARRGMPFRGALYAGLILTADRGPILLEFNARLGDPEAQAILPRVAVPLAPLLLAAARGALDPAAGGPRFAGDVLPATPGAAVAIVLAQPGLPGGPLVGRRHRRARRRRRERRPRLPRRHAARGGRRLGDRRRAHPRGRRPRRGPRRRAAGRRGGRRRGGLPRPPAPPRHRRRRAADRRRGPGPVIRRYTRPEMGAAWSDEARFAAMLRVELAVAKSQVARGMVPADAFAVIAERARIDVARIAEIERTTDHDVIAFVSQVAEAVGPEGRYLHLGLTSSDVVDTALALQLRAAGDLLLRGIDGLLGAVIARARAEAGTVMMGRTHSVHAEPTTLGHKLAGWAFELDRDRLRLAAPSRTRQPGRSRGRWAPTATCPPSSRRRSSPTSASPWTR